MDKPQQTFRSRKAAHEWLVAESVPVSQSKFYTDAKRLKLVKPDKSVDLADLLAYVKSEIKFNALSGQSLGEVDEDKRRSAADIKKAEADADKAEMQAEAMRREMDSKWVLRERAEEEACVWTGRLRDAAAYHLGKQTLALIHAAGGQPARIAEVQAVIDDALAAAANEIANAEEVTVMIEDLEEDPCS